MFMLDLRLIREQPEEVRARLGLRGQDTDWQGLLKLDKERRDLLTKVEELRHQRKTVSDQIAKLKRDKQSADSLVREMKDVGDRIKALEDSLRDSEERLNAVTLRIPNIPHSSVPAGAEPAANQEVRRWGAQPALAFPAKPHWDIGESLGILDFERAARMTGARFAVLPDPDGGSTFDQSLPAGNREREPAPPKIHRVHALLPKRSRIVRKRHARLDQAASVQQG